MGESGEVMVALMILMAVTCTGSAEVIAVTSILVYDIYQIYLKVRDICASSVIQVFTFVDQSIVASVRHVTMIMWLIFSFRLVKDREFVTCKTYYLRRRLESREGIVMLGVCLCVCLSVRRAATARRISLGGEGNALYPVLSSFFWIVMLKFTLIFVI